MPAIPEPSQAAGPQPASPQPVSDDLAHYLAWAREIKEGVVSRSPTGDEDMAPVVEFTRDGATVALVFCSQVDRDEALQAAALGIPGWSADRVVLLLDTHQADQRFTERFGRLPDPLELGELCHTERACEIGLITDAIAVTVADRNGRRAMITLPYHVHPAESRVHWVDDERALHFDTAGDTPGELRVEGYIFDALEHAFATPVLMDKLAGLGLVPSDFGLDPDGPEARIHADLAVLRIMTQGGFGVAFNTPTPLHEQLLEGTLANVAGLAVRDADGNVRHSTGEASVHDDLLRGLFRIRLETERAEAHAADVEERHRRRTERGEEVSRA